MTLLFCLYDQAETTGCHSKSKNAGKVRKLYGIYQEYAVQHKTKRKYQQLYMEKSDNQYDKKIAQKTFYCEKFTIEIPCLSGIMSIFVKLKRARISW